MSEHLVDHTLKKRRQILMVDQCQLKRIGSLAFDVSLGACAQRDNQEIFICFEEFDSYEKAKTCRRAVGQFTNFTRLTNSAYPHGLSRIAVTQGQP